MKNRKKVSFPRLKISKYFILFLIFLALLTFSEKPAVTQKFTPKKNYYQSPEVSLSPSRAPFTWDVEKVDEHITKISLPPDPRMSTPEELFIAMNDYRKAQNAQVLQKSDLLCSIAENRAKEQLEKGNWITMKGLVNSPKTKLSFKAWEKFFLEEVSRNTEYTSLNTAGTALSRDTGKQ